MSPPRYSVVSAQALAGLDVFSALSAAERERIVPLFLGRRFQVNEPIIGQRTSEQAVYFIVSGEVRVKHFSARGRAVSFRDMAAGEMFGELAALDGQPRSAEVAALEPTFIASLTSERFLTLLRDSPEVALSVMRRLTRLVRALSDRVVDFSTLAVRNRIHAEVLRLARQAGVENNRAEIKKMPTHEEIAARVSTHREAVVRELKTFKDCGLIEKPGHRRLIVLDVARLERIVEKGLAADE